MSRLGRVFVEIADYGSSVLHIFYNCDAEPCAAKCQICTGEYLEDIVRMEA